MQDKAAKGRRIDTTEAFSVAEFSRWTVVSKLRFIAPLSGPGSDAATSRKELKIPDLGYAASQVARLLRQDCGVSISRSQPGSLLNRPS